ncbi:hypothetical protein CROQUDRAFT_17649, partial [Cronartium quercuum f. sp. fusiforme G11]
AARPHPLPPRPASWASVTGRSISQVPPRSNLVSQPPPPPPAKTVNEFKASMLVIQRALDQNPFEGMPATQVVHNVNKVLESIGATLDGQPVRITAVAILKPLGDIKMYTSTHAKAQWLMEHKHQWMAIADPCLITQAAHYLVVIHLVPANVQPTSPEFLSRLLAQNTSIMPHLLHSARWLMDPMATNKTHGSIVVNFLDKDLPGRIEKGGLRYEGLFLRGSHYKRTPTQCFRCHKLGHIAARCRNDPICARCSEKHDTCQCQLLDSDLVCGHCIQRDTAQGSQAPDRDDPKYTHLPRSTGCPLR